MSSDCRECRAGVEHCHGTIIYHALRRSECTEGECDQPDGVLHAFRIDCEALGCRCGEATALAV
ncbi:hypothetical protein [Mycobacterium sp.]|jgi:hypothetical protein|uniref:hypothetical protein n=1 Tax=Mycobacterium sp. TaxID=1785 RepID=UPI002D64D52B|nr:hypothetical protein [Mycobacterium sp.]HZA10129.1 hypothetical protein [Mycobacterium sp.]